MPKANKVGKSRQTAAAAKLTQPPRILGTLATKEKQGDNPKNNNKNKTQKAIQQAEENIEKIKAEMPTNSNSKEDLSRGQRRRQAKREQYLKKEQMILSTLKLHKQDEQKKRIDGLDALKEALLDTVQDQPEDKESSSKEEKKTSAPTITSNKAKQRVVASELNRMGLVLQHPAFQSNPFEALQEHLRNTLASQGEEQSKQAQQRIAQEQQAATKRKQDRKERIKENPKKKRHGSSKFKARRTSRNK